jgi:hypothetical protein
MEPEKLHHSGIENCVALSQKIIYRNHKAMQNSKLPQGVA